MNRRQQVPSTVCHHERLSRRRNGRGTTTLRLHADDNEAYLRHVQTLLSRATLANLIWSKHKIKSQESGSWEREISGDKTDSSAQAEPRTTGARGGGAAPPSATWNTSVHTEVLYTPPTPTHVVAVSLSARLVSTNSPSMEACTAPLVERSCLDKGGSATSRYRFISSVPTRQCTAHSPASLHSPQNTLGRPRVF